MEKKLKGNDISSLIKLLSKALRHSSSKGSSTNSSNLQNSGNSIFNSSNGNNSGASNTSNQGNKIVADANKYVGMNNNNGFFSQGQKTPLGWCHNFVDYAYRQATGKTEPWDSTSDPSKAIGPKELYNWAKKNNKLTDKSKAKPGDVILYNINADPNTQHEGIVQKIDPDGTIHTIEGNWENKVSQRTIKPNDPAISGFVST